jgi:hypothetical protein
LQILEPQKVTFSQTDQFMAKPDFQDKEVPNQWHGRFTRTGKTKDSDFLAVLQVDCKNRDLVEDVGLKNGQYVVMLKNATVKIDENGAEVSPIAH